jgi:A-factor type gamma-butyrolactone 1'-reductase (1S-forming)
MLSSARLDQDKDMIDFTDKVVIVTGASSGLGEAAALKFAAYGARVVVAARREDKGRAVVDKIAASGGKGLFVATDVTSRIDIEALIENTLSAYGRLDCAVNNAGIVGPIMTPVAEIEEESWDHVMNTNLKSVWMCMKYEIPAMLREGRGTIVNVSSIYGLKPGDFGMAPFATSSAGVIGLSKTAAVDYAGQGININVVAPGFAHSEMVDPVANGAPDFMQSLIDRHSAADRLGQADEVADAIVWLCSDAARFVNGAVLNVDGGGASRLY